MSLSIELLETDRAIQQAVNVAIADFLNKQVLKNSPKTIKQLKPLIRSWIAKSPELASLRDSGSFESLGSQFGIRQGNDDAAVDAIVTAVSESISTKIQQFDKGLRGRIEFNFQPRDFRNLLGLPEGFVLTNRGQSLHWLNWLLTQGNNTVVAGYSYVPIADGRSGGGVMEFGGSFRVPPVFSGTPDNNFVTRAFSGKEKDIQKIIEGMLSS